MVRALRLQGIKADIATTNDAGNQLLRVPLQQWIEYQGVPVQFFDRFSPNISSIREFAFSSSLTEWLWYSCQQYDLLHVHAIFSYPSTMAMSIARLRQVPYIVRPLGQLCQWSLQQGQRKKQIYLNLLERANLQGSRAVHFTSAQEQHEAKQLGLSAASFITPHGLVMPDRIPDARQQLRQQLNLPDNQPIILFLSRLHPKKGLDYLIPALAACRDLPFTFILAGEGSPSYEVALKKQIQSAGLTDRTLQAGFATGEFKQLLLQGSDLFALTSYSENFGLAVLEALAAGLPVLTTPNVALADLVEQEQLGWVVPLDEQIITNQIRQVLQSPQLAQVMRTHAQSVVRDRYSWQAIASLLIHHYQNILQPTAGYLDLAPVN